MRNAGLLRIVSGPEIIARQLDEEQVEIASDTEYNGAGLKVDIQG